MTTRITDVRGDLKLIALSAYHIVRRLNLIQKLAYESVVKYYGASLT